MVVNGDCIVHYILINSSISLLKRSNRRRQHHFNVPPSFCVPLPLQRTAPTPNPIVPDLQEALPRHRHREMVASACSSVTVRERVPEPNLSTTSPARQALARRSESPGWARAGGGQEKKYILIIHTAN